MDFPSMPQWYTGIFITRRGPDKPSIEIGDGLEVNVEGRSYSPWES